MVDVDSIRLVLDPKRDYSNRPTIGNSVPAIQHLTINRQESPLSDPWVHSYVLPQRNLGVRSIGQGASKLHWDRFELTADPAMIVRRRVDLATNPVQG